MIGKLYIPDLRVAAANRPVGYLEEILASGRVENDVVLHIDYDIYTSLQQKYNPTILREGVGTELKKLLSKIGIQPSTNCKCNQRIIEMNHKGVEWCEQNIDMIIGWLKEEADRAKLPFIALGARIVVRQAIHNSRKAQPS